MEGEKQFEKPESSKKETVDELDAKYIELNNKAKVWGDRINELFNQWEELNKKIQKTPETKEEWKLFEEISPKLDKVSDLIDELMNRDNAIWDEIEILHDKITKKIGESGK